MLLIFPLFITVVLGRLGTVHLGLQTIPIHKLKGWDIDSHVIITITINLKCE
jgi:hypothetical protein